MPTIHIIDSIRIWIYFDDHMPPHFHAKYNEFEEVITIKTLETYSGYLPNKERKKVMEWAEKNQDLLKTKWEQFNQ
jgi:hypothetical protein